MTMWTAWGSFFEAAQISAESAVLVQGATTSAGLWAVLLGKNRGCNVFATTRKQEKAEKLEQAGADDVLLEENLSKSLKKIAPKAVDCILELLGPNALLSFTFHSLKRHGTVVAYGVFGGWGLRQLINSYRLEYRRQERYHFSLQFGRRSTREGLGSFR